MNTNRCCGNCKNFKEEDADGYGWCELTRQETYCGFSNPCHEPLNNGWTLITQENVEEADCLPQERVAIAWFDTENRFHSAMLIDCSPAITTMAKIGGYYYFVLPELKIE